MTSALEDSKESVSHILFFNYCGGRMEGMMGLATQLIGFFSLHDSSLLIVARGFFLLGILVYEKETVNEKPRLQVPCRG